VTARLWGQEEGSLELDRCCLCTFDVILEGPILARASVIQIHVGQEPEQGHETDHAKSKFFFLPLAAMIGTPLAISVINSETRNCQTQPWVSGWLVSGLMLFLGALCLSKSGLLNEHIVNISWLVGW